MRLMIWSDPPSSLHKPSSGYGKVADHLMNAFRKDHKVGYTPMGQSNNLGIFRWAENLYIYPSGNHRFGEDVICPNCYHMNSDLTLVLKDPYFTERAETFPLEYVWYVPVDSPDLHPHIEHVLKTAFKVVAMSEFGRRELEAKRIRVDAVIPHGVDLGLYRPVEGVERENCRRFFTLDPGSFYVGFIGMNRQRKMAWRALQVFNRIRELAGEDADIKYMMWTDVYQKIPLLHQMAHLGLTDRVYWPQRKAYNMGIPEDMMYRWYNSLDVLINPGPEGFWLPGPEAAACGIPTVVSDYAAAPEVAQFTAKVGDTVWCNEAGLKMPLVDIDDMAETVLKIYDSDWERLRKQQLERAQWYDWGRVLPEWNKVLNGCETELRPMYTSEGLKPWDQKLE